MEIENALFELYYSTVQLLGQKKQLTLGKEEEEIGRSLACTVPINGGIYLNEASKSPESLIKTTE